MDGAERERGVKEGCAWKMRERGGSNWKGWTLRQKKFILNDEALEFTPSNRIKYV